MTVPHGGSSIPVEPKLSHVEAPLDAFDAAREHARAHLRDGRYAMLAFRSDDSGNIGATCHMCHREIV